MSQSKNDNSFSMYPVFVNGTEGYACYRIPSIIRMGNGDLLATAEGRLSNCGDHGGIIRVVGKISQDSGVTWGDVFVIAQNILADGSEHVAQNASPVLDTMDPAHPQGKVIIVYNNTEFGEQLITEGKGVRRVYTIESVDHGRTWVNETDITSQVHHPKNPTYKAVYTDAEDRYNNPEDWRMNFPATGHGIQLRGGVKNNSSTQGRIFYCAKMTTKDHSVLFGQSYVYWSDDHGLSWEIGGVSDILGVNESMAVELEDGNIMVNFRNNTGEGGTKVKTRGVMVHQFDDDGNISMATSHIDDTQLPEPTCQASIHRYTWSDDIAYGSKSRILFSNPDSKVNREKMTVRLSYDDGNTWAVSKRIDKEPASYGDLVVMNDMRIGLIYEPGSTGGIVFATFTLEWLTDGQDTF